MVAQSLFARTIPHGRQGCNRRSLLVKAVAAPPKPSKANNKLGERALGFVSKVQPKLLIDGKFVDAAGGETFTSVDPRNGNALLEIAMAKPKDVDRAVDAARKAFDEGPWPRMSGRERAGILFKLADLLEENAEELALLETLDNGKTYSQSSTVDIPETIYHFRYFAGFADKIEGATIPVGSAGVTGKGFTAYTLREPIGVVGQILPWNFPALMAAWKLAPALAVGCTVVLKVSQHTPMTGLRIAELALEAGLPPGVLNVLTGKGSDIGDAICNHPGIDKVAFTGSTKIGKIIGGTATGNLKPVTLELGGNSPVIVTDTADLEAAALGAHEALFFNAGQACECGARVFVDERVYDEFCARSIELAKGRKTGDPFDPDVKHGPMISEQQMDKVLELIESGKKQGAKLVAGGERLGEEGYFLQPTVFVDVQDDMDIARDEIFGPVQIIFKYKTLEEGLRRANDTNYGLASAVWTKDIETMQLASRTLKAGTVWVNTHHVLDAAVPFGGYKESGLGREHGKEVLEHYTQVRDEEVCQ
uniref:Aldehyde dehydrogenase domain-containing protein n=1 Tax=Auxenochlorella protothecoides TaxID=3075 RepID=A0A1D2ACJ9_AUXPR